MRLRTAVIALAIAAAGGGAALAAGGVWVPGLWLLILAVAVIVTTVCERGRYRNRASSPGARWEHTGERFEDPATGERMEVLYDRASGERRYVREGETLPGSDV